MVLDGERKLQPTEAARELVLLPSLKASPGPAGGWVLTRKYLNGVAEYARSWPGPVTSLVRLADEPLSDMDPVEVGPGDAGPRVELRPSDPHAFRERLRHAAAVLAFLSPFELETARLCHELGVPLIFTSEYTLRTEWQILEAEVVNPLLRWRRKFWAWQAERKRRDALRLAAGLQCSGTPTYEVYRRIRPDAMIFFDNRVPRHAVVQTPQLSLKREKLLEGGPLRLVFGGRLIAMKGVRDLPRFALSLKRMGVAFTLDIYGRGVLERELEHDIQARGLQKEVRLRGVMDFDSEWIPMLKDRADLFICCHPQGDPSSTYPEVMSCGVPIAGYANEAFVGVVGHSGAGWVSPIGDPQALACLVARLSNDRGEIARAAEAAGRFAQRHAFEATFAARVAHMKRLSRLPEAELRLADRHAPEARVPA
jgi:colanic acid/amylovoran biosynthesis glycosyltransferase